MVLGCGASTAWSGTIFVDNHAGDDRLNGMSDERVSDVAGPVRTLRRAMAIVRPGDQLSLANHGTPYLGGAALVGAQHSGNVYLPFEIHGNGAILTGAKPIDPGTWRMVDGNVALWRVTPSRKGWYQLVLNGEAVREILCDSHAVELPPLDDGTWCAFQGAIYYRPMYGQIPADIPLQLADEQTGLTLLGVEHVVIRDLTFEHFRIDGVHIHDRCRDVSFVNVTCRQNGRAGLVVQGTSAVELTDVTLAANRKESLIVEELAVANSEGLSVDREPTVNPLVPGP